MLSRPIFLIAVSVILSVFSTHQVHGQNPQRYHTTKVVSDQALTSDVTSSSHAQNGHFDKSRGQGTVVGFNPLTNKPDDSSRSPGTVFGFNPVNNKPEDSNLNRGTVVGFNPIINKPADSNPSRGTVFGFNPVINKQEISNDGRGAKVESNSASNTHGGFTQSQMSNIANNGNSYRSDDLNQKTNILNRLKELVNLIDGDSLGTPSTDFNSPSRSDVANKFNKFAANSGGYDFREGGNNIKDQTWPNDYPGNYYRVNHGHERHHWFNGYSDRNSNLYSTEQRMNHAHDEHPKEYFNPDYRYGSRRLRRSDDIVSSGQQSFYANNWNVS